MSQAQGFAVSAPAAVAMPVANVDDIEIGAFDHFSMPTKLAIGAGIVGIGGAAGYAAYGMAGNALAGSALAAEGTTAAGFTGMIVSALPVVAGLMAAGAVSYGAYLAIEKLLGGKTVATRKDGTVVAKPNVAQELAGLDIDPAILPTLVAAIEKHNADKAAAKAQKKAAKANKQLTQQAGGLATAG